MSRKLQHLELNKDDALALRELVRPFDENGLPEFARPILARLCLKIYGVLVELESEEVVQMPISEEEILIINQKVSNEDWERASAVLRQTWNVLYELKNDINPALFRELEEAIQPSDRESTTQS